MIYPKSPFCPLNEDNAKRRTNNQGSGENTPSPPDNMQNLYGKCNKPGKSELMNIINELEFAATDLNLFLDTHPDDEEALKTFTQIAAALKSYKHDYVQKYGPLYAVDSSDETPFEWVSAEYKWPWQI